jgi:acyl carrier protein
MVRSRRLTVGFREFPRIVDLHPMRPCTELRQSRVVNCSQGKASELTQDMQTLELLHQYLQTKASIDPVKVTPEAKLEDIGVDSLILIDLMYELEDSLNVRVPDVDTRPTTVSELTQLFDALAAAQLKTGT